MTEAQGEVYRGMLRAYWVENAAIVRVATERCSRTTQISPAEARVMKNEMDALDQRFLLSCVEAGFETFDRASFAVREYDACVAFHGQPREALNLMLQRREARSLAREGQVADA